LNKNKGKLCVKRLVLQDTLGYKNPRQTQRSGYFKRRLDKYGPISSENRVILKEFELVNLLYKRDTKLRLEKAGNCERKSKLEKTKR